MLPKALEEHQLSHRQYECDICGKLFGTKFNINTHKKNVHEKIKVACDICYLEVWDLNHSSSFILILNIQVPEKNLPKHIKDEHEVTKCPICLAVFSSKTSMKIHKRNTKCRPNYAQNKKNQKNKVN